MAMNKTMKTVLCVSGCVFAIGTVCCGIGYALGARPDDIPYNRHMNMNGFHIDDWADYYDDWDDNYDDWDGCYNDSSYNTSGHRSDHVTHHESPDSIKSLNIVSACSSISVIEDDTNKIEFLNIDENDLTISNENGVYTINIANTNCNNNYDQRVLVKVKDDSVLDLLKIDSQVGAISVKDLDFKEIDIYSNTGAIKLIDVDSEKTTVKADVGAIYMEGDFRNDTVIEGSVGAIDLELDDHHAAYDYVIHHNMGMVMIDGESMKLNTDEIANNNSSAKHHLKVTNDAGMINIDFGD